MKKSPSRWPVSRRQWLVQAAGLAGSGTPALGLAATPAQPGAVPTRDPHTLWYDRPADTWVQALPVGNGRLGGMVFGGVTLDRLQFNENSLFAGGPYDPGNPRARLALPEVQRLIFAGRYREAEVLANEALISVPTRQMPFQPMGELMLLFPGLENVTGYTRQLDLRRAVATTRFTTGGTVHSREVLASAPDQVLVLRLAANKPRAVTVDIGTWAAHQTGHETALASPASSTGGEVTFTVSGISPAQGGVPGRLPFEYRLQVRYSGGTARPRAGGVYVSGADEVLLVLAAATGYRRYDDVSGDPAAANAAALQALAGRDAASLLQAHLQQHTALFDRVELTLGAEPAEPAEAAPQALPAALRPTDERLRAYEKAPDPALAALYFHYGRYLLLASSRGTRHPANLQGLWNEKLQPSWQSKWTLNINTQMNYWPAELCQLPETVEPLFALVEDLAETGARVARDMYGAPGWVAFNNTDVWRVATPPDGAVWALWPLGGAWLLQNLWEAWLFRRDPALIQRLYPLLKGAATFFLATLVQDPQSGYMVTNPSLSPENRHPHGSSLCAGPAIDNQLLRDLFEHTAEAARLLGSDAAFAQRCSAMRSRLPPERVGAQGQLQEWQQDWDAGVPDPLHRHVSHLYALYPSNQITPEATPALAAAAQRTLELRGDDATGWGIGWRINLWARLKNGDRAHAVLTRLLHPRRTYPNLFDAHPPFQIDGNFGGTAGIAEMLLQSHHDGIELLPALPTAWAQGRLRGLAARGGFVVDLAWAGGLPTTVAVTSARGGSTPLRWRDQRVVLSLRAGETARLVLNAGRLQRPA